MNDLTRTLPRLALLLLAMTAPGVRAEATLDSALELWSYLTSQSPAQRAPFNPDNKVARLPLASWTNEARLNLRYRSGDNEAVIRPRLIDQHDRHPDADHQDALLTQAFWRARPTSSLTLVAGRELLGWGPGNFRSPSHPFYFDAGKTNPLRDVSGLDLVRGSYTASGTTLTLARVFDNARLPDRPLERPLTLLKADWQGDDHLASLIVADTLHGAPFVGSFAQIGIGDAWLLYGEAGLGRRARQLTMAPGPWPLWQPLAPAPRRITALVGATYTLESGNSLSAEWLADGHGLRHSEVQALNRRAGQLAQLRSNDPRLPALLGQGLAALPAPLARNSLFLMWQKNPQAAGLFWRLTWNAGLEDRGQALSAYGEKSLSDRWSLFAVASANLGPEGAESRRVLQQSLSIGLKLMAF